MALTDPPNCRDLYTEPSSGGVYAATFPFIRTTVDRTDAAADPDDLLETALTEPNSFDVARTSRLVAQLTHDDPEVRRAVSWTVRFVAEETLSLVDSCTGRFRQTLRAPDARSVVLRTLAVVAEHNEAAVGDIVDNAAEEAIIDRFVARRAVSGY